VSGVAAAAEGAAGKKPAFVSQRAVDFGRTPALWSLPPEVLNAPPGENAPLVINRANEKRVKLPVPGAGAGLGSFFDSLLLQQPLRPDAMPGPTLTFNGMGVAGSAPPDTTMDVGPSHVVELVNNSRIQVFDKAGASLFGPVSIRTLFVGLPDSSACKAGGDDGDPIVLYDPLADRWLISQFEVSAFPNHQCIAISQTGDPTGAYFAYAFAMPAPPEVPAHKFQDYPHYGVWPDAYYLTTNQFNQALTAFVGGGVFAFDRVKMLAGDPAASYVYVDVQPIDASAGGMLPTDLDGYLPPPAGLSNMIMEFRADEFGDPGDTLRVYEFVPDFGNPGASAFDVRPDIALAAFDARQPSGRADIEQLGGDGLDSIPDRLMFRLAYRNLGAPGSPANSWVGNFTVNVSGVNPSTASTYQTGIRWFELHSAATALPTLFDEGTHNLAPGNGAAGLNNWMGSIAQDNDGNVALGFSQSGTGQRADIKIAGRSGPAAAGTLNEGEALFHAATGSQTGTANRWGDYSQMAVDPADDCTFWYAQEYYAVNGNFAWSTRIGSFVFPGCTAAQKGTLDGQITYCSSGLPLPGATVSVDGVPFVTTDAGGAYDLTLPPGSYTVSIAKAGFTVASGPVVITDGGTTTFNACLSGTPTLVSAGATLVAEGCAPGNGLIDPGETVTVSFCVRNEGGLDTTNLTGDLEEQGGVGDAPLPAEFGVVVAGGPDVCVDVTFTAADELVCGEALTASLELEDGPADLGVLAYGFATGAPIVTLSEGFDGVVAPALPAGWVASGIGNLWATSTTTPDTAPNHAFADDPAIISDKSLEWPATVISSSAAQLSFRNYFDMELTYDGGVLEVSVNGGPYQDILVAGGTFVSGGYTGTIDSGFMSPIAGRQAWTGNSGAYVTSTVALPATMQGQSVVLRWRMASDVSVSDVGWRVDSVSLSDGFSCCTPIPEGLDVDAGAPFGAPTALLNSVWEPGETVIVEPSYFNGNSAALPLTGTVSNLIGPAGAVYTIVDSGADYGSILPNTDASCLALGNCYAVSVDAPVVRPAPHWDATIDEALSNGAAKTWTLHIGASFADVPDTLNFYPFIETIFHKGVTTGCGAPNYCPSGAALRKQMAVFLLKARYGAAYVPPTATGIFSDVPQADQFAPWIEDLYNRGITTGCSVSPLSFCPENTVLRQQMAVFLLKTREGSDYEPPDCEDVFDDVPCPAHPFADWIEELADEGITSGCGGNNFCPAAPNTRGQMAVFLTKTFGLRLYAP
jgi:hypothetical protein